MFQTLSCWESPELNWVKRWPLSLSHPNPSTQRRSKRSVGMRSRLIRSRDISSSCRCYLAIVEAKLSSPNLGAYLRTWRASQSKQTQNKGTKQHLKSSLMNQQNCDNWPENCRDWVFQTWFFKPVDSLKKPKQNKSVHQDTCFAHTNLPPWARWIAKADAASRQPSGIEPSLLARFFYGWIYTDLPHPDIRRSG